MEATEPIRSPRVLLVSSAGGHLLQLERLRPWWQRFDRAWVTFPLEDARSRLAGERAAWAHHPVTRNIPNLIRNTSLAWRLIRRYRPSVVVSTGAGVAVPFFLVARAHRIPTVFIEAVERTERPSLTGRLCAPISTLILLQREEQRALYPRGHLIGRLL
jgi:nitroreductase